MSPHPCNQFARSAGTEIVQYARGRNICFDTVQTSCGVRFWLMKMWLSSCHAQLRVQVLLVRHQDVHVRTSHDFFFAEYNLSNLGSRQVKVPYMSGMQYVSMCHSVMTHVSARQRCLGKQLTTSLAIATDFRQGPS